MKNRGGSGVCVHNISDKTGLLTGIASVSEDDDVMLITDQGQIVRTPVSGIPVYSRSASGVIVMRLSGEQKIVNFTKVAREDKLDGEGSDNAVPEDVENVEKEDAHMAELENMDSVTTDEEI
jgi:DNA gyrase subunit A